MRSRTVTRQSVTSEDGAVEAGFAATTTSPGTGTLFSVRDEAAVKADAGEPGARQRRAHMLLAVRIAQRLAQEHAVAVMGLAP